MEANRHILILSWFQLGWGGREGELSEQLCGVSSPGGLEIMTVFHLHGMQNPNFSNSSYTQLLHFSSVVSKNCGSGLQNVLFQVCFLK